MQKKIVLIDGNSIINRAFYGIPLLTNGEGLHTNAVYGFLNIMFKILDEEQPDYLAVAFDVKHPTFRHKMFAEYKGTRKPMPSELREQVPLLKDVLHAMNIVTLEAPGYEADDILGTIAKDAESKGMRVAVISGDRDLLQLATENIMVRIPKTKAGGTEVENYNTQDVLDKMGVRPDQIIELKGLMGDSSDNIPGLPGVGEKTAVAILTQFDNIESAYAHVEEIKPPRAKTAMMEHINLARLSRELATINIHSEIEYKFEDMLIGEFYNEDSYNLFKRLEFKNFLNKFNLEATSKQPNVEIVIANDASSAADAEKHILEQLKTAAEESATLALGITAEDGIFAAAFAVEEEMYVLVEDNDLSKDKIIEIINILTDAADNLVLADLKTVLKEIDIEESSKLFDVSIAAYLLNPLRDSYMYDDIAGEFLGGVLISKKEKLGKDKLSKVYRERQEDFAYVLAQPAAVALKAMPVIKERLKAEGMYQIFTDVEMPLVFVLDSMEKYGIKAKRDELESFSVRLKSKIDELESDIYKLAGEEFNINSPKQLGVILFEKLGLKGGKKTKTGYSTAADVLEKMAPENPIVSQILEYRQLTKLKSTYADALPTYIAEDGRIHSSFNQTITATGRISSTEPNLQNIPVRMELGREIRKVFVPEDGYIFVDADYSQIELRVLAHMSADKNLIEAYRSEADIHALTASQVFHVPIEQVTKTMRSNAKAVNFGIIYGISSFGLSQDLSITRKEAQEYMESYFKSYPSIKALLDHLVNDAKDKGYSETIMGRRRPIPELKSSNFMQRAFGERVAMNAPMQGTAADIIKVAMIDVDRELKKRGLKSRLILQVHDELLIEAWLPEKEEVLAILKDKMMGAADMAVPLEISVSEGNNWYEAK